MSQSTYKFNQPLGKIVQPAIKIGVEVSSTHLNANPSAPAEKRISCSSAFYRRHFAKPNFDVYNTDGMVIGRDT